MTRLIFSLTLLLGYLFFILLSCPCAWANNEIFPAEPAAQSSDHWENGYFVINEKPVFINSGSIHYARVPRELWRDRIWRLKMMGFNCAQSYVFWNATEPKKGVFDFTDNLDLDAWLSLLQEMGMYALVRPGPYSCAEWEEGGYPSWLNADPGMIQREMGPSVPFSDAYLKKVYDIIDKHQVNHAGNVFLVQIENEHRPEWGTEASDPYLKYLDVQARASGIEVPMFNSGLHHSNEPPGETPFSVGTSPWYSTEFWTLYFNFYGEMKPGALAEKTRGAWKITAFGGAGYNFYMALGGSNFGYSGDSFSSSYDFAAPIGEAGQLRQFYYLARRAAYFDQTFTPLLAGSHNDPKFATCNQPELRVTTRTNPTGGSIVFVDHFLRNVNASAAHLNNSPDQTILSTQLKVAGLTLPHHGSLKVGTLEPQTFLVNFPWTANATFESVCTNVLFRKTLGTTDYWICYGPAGDLGEITLTRKVADPSPAHVEFTYPDGDAVTELNLDSGDGHQAKFLVMNTEMTNRTWLAHDKIYTGPSFVMEDGSMEFPSAGGKATIYSAAGKSDLSQVAVTLPELPTLAPWSWRDAAPERNPAYNTTGWLSSVGPRPTETYDEFENRYGWYRTTVHADTAGPISLRFSGLSAKLVTYLNGELSDISKLDLKAGDNSLAILVKLSPRQKGLTYYTDPVGTRRSRGLWGGVSTDPSAALPQVEWKKTERLAPDVTPENLSKPDYDDSSWEKVEAKNELPIGTGITFRGVFSITADQIDSSLEMSKIGNFPAFFLNGQRLDDRTQNVSKILIAGKNSIVVQTSGNKLGDKGTPSLLLWPNNDRITNATWRFLGGLNDLQETAIIGRVTNWQEFLQHAPWQTGDPAMASQPTFWKSTFTYHPTTVTKETIGLVTSGLTAGHVWLNGHNLGECPQKVLMYMPECWLKDGANDLVIFDLAGAKPDQVHFSRFESFALAGSK